MTTAETAFETGPADHIEALIDLTESLNLIFEEENAAIEERRLDALPPLQAEKARLAAAYAQSIRTVASERRNMCEVRHDLLIRLRSSTAAFEARAAHQRALLDDADGNA